MQKFCFSAVAKDTARRTWDKAGDAARGQRTGREDTPPHCATIVYRKFFLKAME